MGSPRNGVLVAVLTLLAAACGGGGGGDEAPPPPPPPDLAGFWAGTWEGVDSVFGRVTGTWEGEVSQSPSGVTGSFFLGGDVDCAEGTLAGAIPSSGAPTGTLERLPCPSNEWILTALDLPTRSASGTWTKPATGGGGSFTGTQVATPGGPRIAFFSPPGGGPGTIVTLSGSGLFAAAAGDILFDGVPAAEIRSSAPGRVVTAVPHGAGTGRVFLSTSAGTAISPWEFRADSSHPSAVAGGEIFAGAAQEGVAVSPDGRRLYVAAGDTGVGAPAVLLVDTASRQVLAATPVPAAAGGALQGLAVSPDGRRVYVAAGPGGVAVLHGVSAALLGLLPIPSGDGSRPNPQGVAVSPDGALLYVSDSRDGGSVTVWDLAAGAAVASVGAEAGVFPAGVAAAPDGEQAYFALARDAGDGEIAVYDVASRTLTQRWPAGSKPVGLAVTPDGRRLLVSHESGNEVAVIDTATGQPAATVAVGTQPAGVAVSPDGRFAYAANRGGQTVTVIDLATAQVSAAVAVLSGPVGIALGPDGLRGYVAHRDSSFLSQLGEAPVLTVAKGGTGIGTVTSSPAGIECGPTCTAGFPPGTVVALAAVPAGGSVFSGWSGDSDCFDGVVTVQASLTCVATFTGTSSGGGGGSGGGSCFVRAAAQ